jgi:hypothetical protein
METREGFSTQYGSTKFDIALSDTDFELLLREFGLTTDAQYTVGQKAMLMKNETRLLALYEGPRMQAMTAEAAAEEIRQCQENRMAWMQQLQTTNGAAPASESPQA